MSLSSSLRGRMCRGRLLRRDGARRDMAVRQIVGHANLSWVCFSATGPLDPAFATVAKGAPSAKGLDLGTILFK